MLAAVLAMFLMLQRDAFVPLNDYLETTLADTYASMPEAAWQAVTINGNVYGVPAQKDFGARYNLEANQTLIDDVGRSFPRWRMEHCL